MANLVAEMILAFDSSSAACTAALFSKDGELLACRDDIIERGHAELLVPMLQVLMDGQRADHVIVGVGPGSFTGIRVAIAAAHGLAIGWDCALSGMNSLALLAAGAMTEGAVAAAVTGGHGELFVEGFDGATLQPLSPLANLTPKDAALRFDQPLVVGSGAQLLVAARGSGKARLAVPSARHALVLPEALRALEPKPLYARAPDAKAAA